MPRSENMFNIRSQFPILKRKINGKPLIYFDNAATSQKLKSVIDAEKEFYEKFNSNVHRSINPLGEIATKLYELSRKEIAKFVHAQDASEIVFTKNTTESINVVAQSYGKKYLKKGDIVVLTIAEHHSNIVPWLQLKQEVGIKIHYIPLNKKKHILDITAAKKILAQRSVKFFSCGHASNALGIIHPVSLLIKYAKKRNIITLIDAAQSIPHILVDVQKFGCDFLAFSGHKVFGPTGIGVLWGRKELLKTLPPFLGGGEMIHEVFTDHFTPNEIPLKFEAGTPNICGAIALGQALRFIQRFGLKKIQKIEQELTEYLYNKLSGLPFVELYGFSKPKNHLPIVAFTMEGLHAHDVVDLLGEQGIMLRSGHHCTMPLHRVLGVPATARASLSFYNTKKEIDRFVEALNRIYKRFR